METGKYNKLKCDRETAAGYFLKDDSGKEAILFKRECPDGLEAGKELNVFVYSDSENEFIATLEQPHLILNQFGVLKVNEVNESGAFLDWGIAKDIFVPFREQKLKMLEGRYYLVYLYMDEKSNRIMASAKWNRFVEKENIPFKIGQEVDLLIADKTEMGYNAIINNRYKGLIYNNEVFRPLRLGDKLKGYIKLIREDEKIDLSLQKAGYARVTDQEAKVLAKLKENDGFLALHDKSDPAEVMRELQMSKKTFKQVVGALYKQGIISLEENGISFKA